MKKGGIAWVSRRISVEKDSHSHIEWLLRHPQAEGRRGSPGLKVRHPQAEGRRGSPGLKEGFWA